MTDKVICTNLKCSQWGECHCSSPHYFDCEVCNLVGCAPCIELSALPLEILIELSY